MSGRARYPLWPLLPAALIGLPVLYVASVGPILWLAERGAIPRVLLDFPLYAPVVWLCQASPAMAAAMNWYVVDLWGVTAAF